jgi:hypothetical protein
LRREASRSADRWGGERSWGKWRTAERNERQALALAARRVHGEDLFRLFVHRPVHVVDERVVLGLVKPIGVRNGSPNPVNVVARGFVLVGAVERNETCMVVAADCDVAHESEEVGGLLGRVDEGGEARQPHITPRRIAENILDGEDERRRKEGSASEASGRRREVFLVGVDVQEERITARTRKLVRLVLQTQELTKIVHLKE